MCKYLSLEVYLRAKDTACVIFRTDSHFYRINRLQLPVVVIKQLQDLCLLIGPGKTYKDCIALRDKKRELYLVCNFVDSSASIALWLVFPQDNNAGPKFNWDGTTNAFSRACYNMGKMLPICSLIILICLFTWRSFSIGLNGCFN